MPHADFLAEATERGFVFQCTDTAGLDTALREGSLTAYIGFDCTADSLHVGSLVQIMILRLLQKHGHTPLVLLGGGTTRIGDPSGKDESRQMLSDDQIAANMEGIRRCFDPFLRFGSEPGEAMLADNGTWLNALGYIPLLRDVGTHITVNRMLTFDSVKLRLEREQPLTFLEFNYMILQSYDFRELSRRHAVRLQIGGSDQWGNIIAGIELARRTDGTGLFGLTTPLITTASGAKMGKTARGAVWLTADRVSPYRVPGSSGATRKTPTWAASCVCSPTCRFPKSPGWKRSAGPRSTKRRKCWRRRPPPSRTGMPPRRRQRRRRGSRSRRGKRRRTCRPSRCRRPTSRRAYRHSGCSCWPDWRAATRRRGG